MRWSHLSDKACPLARRRRAGFTLIELLVVIFIILLVSVVALPTVLPALNQRQASEAARILQGALVGARDKAIHDNQPCGIRLLPDPAFPLQWQGSGTAVGQLIPGLPLAYSRVIPIEAAPEYSEGMVSVYPSNVYSAALLTVNGYTGCPCLVLEEAVLTTLGAPNSPTSWFWNIRVGDRVQLNQAGPWYSVVGPMLYGPSQGNSELFVNNGAPGTALPTLAGNSPCEYLLLVNAQDDNNNGWIDEGFDGVDNNGNGTTDENTTNAQGQTTSEWEVEEWQGVAGKGLVSVPYSIRRRPAPSSSSREISLPTAMVIDATAGYGSVATQERSRLPVNLYSGTVDIAINPDGTVAPVTIYSSPASATMAGAFYHFWLADRQDVVSVQIPRDANGNIILPVVPVPINGGTPSYYLPIAQPGGATASATTFPGPYLKADYSILTLNGRTGQVGVTSNPPFFLDPTLGYTNSPGSSAQYNPTYPFIQAEQGVSGGP